jgi:S-adenosylmethionine hydrolase
VSKPIVFVSDLGLRDEFVGVCDAVLARIAPASRVIHLSHGVPPMDIVAGALMLAHGLPFAPEDAVALGIVDPGVGSARKPIAVETGSGRILVGPDNGLLSLAWQALVGARRAVEITSEAVVLASISPVFHGRDVFAPAAARLAAGLPLDQLGPSVEVAGLVAIRIREPVVDRRRIETEVLDVDRFGNVRLSARPEHFTAAGFGQDEDLELATTSGGARARRIDTYGDVRVGEVGVLIDAWGWIAVIRYEASAAELLAVRSGDPVWVVPAG